MDLGLKGRTAIVMGASQGLGEATALQLASEGAHVVLVARRENVLKEVQQRIAEQGGSAEIAVCDLFDLKSRRSISWSRTLVAQRRAWRQGSRPRCGPRSLMPWFWALSR